MKKAEVISNGNVNLQQISSGGEKEYIGAVTKKPCTKVKYATEKNALFYIEKLKNTSKRTVVPIRAYLCPFCLCWHLTSNEKRDEVEKIKKQLIETEMEVSKRDEIIRKKNEEMTALQKKLSEYKDKISSLKVILKRLKNQIK